MARGFRLEHPPNARSPRSRGPGMLQATLTVAVPGCVQLDGREIDGRSNGAARYDGTRPVVVSTDGVGGGEDGGARRERAYDTRLGDRDGLLLHGFEQGLGGPVEGGDVGASYFAWGARQGGNARRRSPPARQPLQPLQPLQPADREATAPPGARRSPSCQTRRCSSSLGLP